MRYRPEIDGLRAIAVLPVLFFHAGFSLFSGGYVGVDVFFVISGYLITSIILPDIYAGTFSLKHFYERRARRILPALFLIVGVSIPFAWAWLTPQELSRFSVSVIAVATFISNFLFSANSGYFARQSELEPLLHTWSLAVEEQFYIFFPLLLIALAGWKCKPTRMFGILLALAISSLLFAEAFTSKHPYASFFLSPLRAWELLLGALLAVYIFERNEIKVSVIWQQLLSVCGLLMIAYSVVMYSDQTPFPSVYTLVPTVGALLVIAFANQDTLAKKLLSFPAIVSIGLISYSLYLWHQPIFVFARHNTLSEPSEELFIALILLSILLAYLSWKFVESPFRNRKFLNTKIIFKLSILGTALLIAIGYLGTKPLKGWDLSYNPALEHIMSFANTNQKQVYGYGTCYIEVNQAPNGFDKTCINSSSDQLFIWGDSHAAALVFGFKKHFPNISQMNLGACPPLLDSGLTAKCEEGNQYVLGAISNTKPSHIVLYANWSGHFHRLEGIQNTINEIQKASPDSRILVVGATPQWNPSLPIILSRTDADLTQTPLYLENVSLKKIAQSNEHLSSLLNQPNVRFYASVDALCEGSKCLATIDHNKKPTPLVWDNAHLTEGGAELLAKKLLKELQQN